MVPGGCEESQLSRPFLLLILVEKYKMSKLIWAFSSAVPACRQAGSVNKMDD
jgi:hypothetical protein